VIVVGGGLQNHYHCCDVFTVNIVNVVLIIHCKCYLYDRIHEFGSIYQ
jgi:hypothetical protein